MLRKLLDAGSAQETVEDPTAPDLGDKAERAPAQETDAEDAAETSKSAATHVTDQPAPTEAATAAAWRRLAPQRAPADEPTPAPIPTEGAAADVETGTDDPTTASAERSASPRTTQGPGAPRSAAPSTAGAGAGAHRASPPSHIPGQTRDPRPLELGEAHAARHVPSDAPVPVDRRPVDAAPTEATLELEPDTVRAQNSAPASARESTRNQAPLAAAPVDASPSRFGEASETSAQDAPRSNNPNASAPSSRPNAAETERTAARRRRETQALDDAHTITGGVINSSRLSPDGVGAHAAPAPTPTRVSEPNPKASMPEEADLASDTESLTASVAAPSRAGSQETPTTYEGTAAASLRLDRKVPDTRRHTPGDAAAAAVSAASKPRTRDDVPAPSTITTLGATDAPRPATPGPIADLDATAASATPRRGTERPADEGILADRPGAPRDLARSSSDPGLRPAAPSLDGLKSSVLERKMAILSERIRKATQPPVPGTDHQASTEPAVPTRASSESEALTRPRVSADAESIQSVPRPAFSPPGPNAGDPRTAPTTGATDARGSAPTRPLPAPGEAGAMNRILGARPGPDSLRHTTAPGAPPSDMSAPTLVGLSPDAGGTEAVRSLFPSGADLAPPRRHLDAAPQAARDASQMTTSFSGPAGEPFAWFKSAATGGVPAAVTGDGVTNQAAATVRAVATDAPIPTDAPTPNPTDEPSPVEATASPHAGDAFSSSQDSQDSSHDRAFDDSRVARPADAESQPEAETRPSEGADLSPAIRTAGAPEQSLPGAQATLAPGAAADFAGLPGATVVDQATGEIAMLGTVDSTAPSNVSASAPSEPPASGTAAAREVVHRIQELAEAHQSEALLQRRVSISLPTESGKAVRLVIAPDQGAHRIALLASDPTVRAQLRRSERDIRRAARRLPGQLSELIIDKELS